MRRLCLVALLALSCGASSVVGQGKTPKEESVELTALLKQLASTSPKAWRARLDALQSKARKLDQQAAKLSAEAATMRRRAAAARSEHERLQKLMALVKIKSKKPAAKPVPKKGVPAKAQTSTPRKAATKPPAKMAAAMAKSSPSKPAKAKPTKAEAAKAKPAKAKPAKAKPAKAKPAKAKPAKAKPPKATPAKADTAKAKATKAKPAKAKPAKATTAKAKAPAMAAAPVPAGGFVTYDDHVQEIFMDNCSACHDDSSKEGGLDLTSFVAARAGGSSGTTIVPGDLDQSRLYQLVAHLQKPTMPPDEPKIAAPSIDLIRRWIAQGAYESVAAARAGARKAAAKPKPKVALRPRFDGPAPTPKDWPEIAPARTVRAVSTKTLATSPRTALLAIPGLGQIHVLDAASGKPIGILPFPHGSIEVLRFSADGSRILAAGGIPGKRGRVAVYTVADGKLASTYGKEFDTVLAAAVHPHLTHVALGGPNRKVKVFDMASGELVYEVGGHNDWVLGIDFSSDGKHLLSCDRAGVIQLSEARSGKNIETIRRHRGAVHGVRFAPSGQSFASVGADATLRLFSIKGARQTTQRSLGTPGLGLAFSMDGERIAVGGRDGRLQVFRKNGSSLTTTAPTGDWVYAVAFDHEGKRVFAGNFQGQTSVFELKTRRRLHLLAPTAPPPPDRGL